MTKRIKYNTNPNLYRGLNYPSLQEKDYESNLELLQREMMKKRESKVVQHTARTSTSNYDSSSPGIRDQDVEDIEDILVEDFPELYTQIPPSRLIHFIKDAIIKTWDTALNEFEENKNPNMEDTPVLEDVMDEIFNNWAEGEFLQHLQNSTGIPFYDEYANTISTPLP